MSDLMKVTLVLTVEPSEGMNAALVLQNRPLLKVWSNVSKVSASKSLLQLAGSSFLSCCKQRKWRRLLCLEQQQPQSEGQAGTSLVVSSVNSTVVLGNKKNNNKKTNRKTSRAQSTDSNFKFANFFDHLSFNLKFTIAWDAIHVQRPCPHCSGTGLIPPCSLLLGVIPCKVPKNILKKKKLH